MQEIKRNTELPKNQTSESTHQEGKHFLKEIINNCRYRIGIFLRWIVQNTYNLRIVIPNELIVRLKNEAVRKKSSSQIVEEKSPY